MLRIEGRRERGRKNRMAEQYVMVPEGVSYGGKCPISWCLRPFQGLLGAVTYTEPFFIFLISCPMAWCEIKILGENQGKRGEFYIWVSTEERKKELTGNKTWLISKGSCSNSKPSVTMRIYISEKTQTSWVKRRLWGSSTQLGHIGNQTQVSLFKNNDN